MASLFTRIVNREIPAHVVAEDDRHLAFLDINPLVVGHTLVIPKKEVDYLFDLEKEDFLELQLFARKVAKAIESEVKCNRIGVAVVGLEVPHAHIHLVPLKTMDDINFARPKLKLSQEQLSETAALIKSRFDSNKEG